MTIVPRIPTMPGRIASGFIPTRMALLAAPSVKRREVLGESHEGWTASYEEPLSRRTFLCMDDSVELKRDGGVPKCFVRFYNTSGGLYRTNCKGRNRTAPQSSAP